MVGRISAAKFSPYITHCEYVTCYRNIMNITITFSSSLYLSFALPVATGLILCTVAQTSTG